MIDLDAIRTLAHIPGAQARARGVQVLVTDHHLPAVVNGQVVVPADCVIVNPNQPGCSFESKSIAGVGVMFYVLLALRAELRERGAFTVQTQPKIDALLPLVALGTVADVVKLDANNRRLVAQGLKRIRAGQTWSPSLIDANVTRMENLALAKGLPLMQGAQLGSVLGSIKIAVRTERAPTSVIGAARSSNACANSTS